MERSIRLCQHIESLDPVDSCHQHGVLPFVLAMDEVTWSRETFQEGCRESAIDKRAPPDAGVGSRSGQSWLHLQAPFAASPTFFVDTWAQRPADCSLQFFLVAYADPAILDTSTDIFTIQWNFGPAIALVEFHRCHLPAPDFKDKSSEPEYVLGKFFHCLQQACSKSFTTAVGSNIHTFDFSNADTQREARSLRSFSEADAADRGFRVARGDDSGKGNKEGQIIGFVRSAVSLQIGVFDNIGDGVRFEIGMDQILPVWIHCKQFRVKFGDYCCGLRTVEWVRFDDPLVTLGVSGCSHDDGEVAS